MHASARGTTALPVPFQVAPARECTPATFVPSGLASRGSHLPHPRGTMLGSSRKRLRGLGRRGRSAHGSIGGSCSPTHGSALCGLRRSARRRNRRCARWGSRSWPTRTTQPSQSWDGPAATSLRSNRLFRAGTLVWIAVARAGLAGSGRGPSWRVAKQVEGRGWQLLGRIWAVGGIDAAFAYVDLDDSAAVRFLLRMPRRRGLRAKLRGTGGLVFARFRLWQLLCREGFVVARTPT